MSRVTVGGLFINRSIVVNSTKGLHLVQYIASYAQ